MTQEAAVSIPAQAGEPIITFTEAAWKDLSTAVLNYYYMRDNDALEKLMQRQLLKLKKEESIG